MDQYEIPYNLSTEITKMNIVPPPPEDFYDFSTDFEDRYYDMEWRKVKQTTESDKLGVYQYEEGDNVTGVFRCSCMSVYPGAMCHPRRVEFVGEKDFDGIVGYGFSNEFPYTEIKGMRG